MSSLKDSASYLQHVNGLRALAILGVLLYHLRADYCPAGYFGVDLFLVISGFLLFRSLLRPGAAESFHYGNFLLRKSWRILPSWFVVTCVVALVSLGLFSFGRMPDVFKTARTSALFHADYYIDASGDYFNVYSQQNPLLHYWYLSITQQLYIVAPLLIIPLTRWCSRRAAIILLASLGGLSLFFYILTTNLNIVSSDLRETLLHAIGAKTAYYHLVPRFWELVAGAAALLLPSFDSSPKLRSSLGILSLVALGGACYMYATGSPAVYLTVVAALLAIRYASSPGAGWLLNMKPVQTLGTISFSLYLWHWPVMVFWKYYRFDAPSVWDELGMVGVSLLLATVSWWTLERIKIPSSSGWKGLCWRCSLLLLIPVVMISASKLNKYARKSEAAIVAQRLTLMAHPEVETDAAMLSGLEKFSGLGSHYGVYRMGSAEHAPGFLMLGDSHAIHLYDALNTACKDAGVRGLLLSGGLAPFDGISIDPAHGNNLLWNSGVSEMILQYLRQHPEIRQLVISLYWSSRLTLDIYRDDQTGKFLKSEGLRLSALEAGLARFCSRVQEMGCEVLLLGDTPSFKAPSPYDEWERSVKFGVPVRERVVTVQEHEMMNESARNMMMKVAADGLAHYVDLAPAMMIDGGYPARLNGQFLYQDSNHLSEVGAQRAVSGLMPQLLELLRNETASSEPVSAAP